MSRIRQGCAIGLLIVGIGLFLFPIISQLYQDYNHSEVIRAYEVSIGALTLAEKEEMWKQAENYNQQLREQVTLGNPFIQALGELNIDYERLLNPQGDGIMGYIEIPRIHVYLPIGHGTEENTLQNGVGHLLNSSLPVGGASTHAVLSAHTGLPGIQLFDELDELKEGDSFYLHILGETLAYQVDQIKVVLPYEVEDLKAIEGEDHVTLLTCTPYGINSHRLLVRGDRIPYVEEEVPTVGHFEIKDVIDWVPYGICLVVICGLMAWQLRKEKRKKREKKNDSL